MNCRFPKKEVLRDAVNESGNARPLQMARRSEELSAQSLQCLLALYATAAGQEIRGIATPAQISGDV